MEKTNENDDKEKQALDLLGTELKVKYPPGSKIVFSAQYHKGEGPVTTSCSWYDKVGGKERPRKNIQSPPPEWINMPYEEALKIGEMFDECFHMNIVYV